MHAELDIRAVLRELFDTFPLAILLKGLCSRVKNGCDLGAWWKRMENLLLCRSLTFADQYKLSS